jgi:hypothetical protein
MPKTVLKRPNTGKDDDDAYKTKYTDPYIMEMMP